MTEKRSEYRKRQKKEKNQKIFQNVKSAFSENSDSSEGLNINPDFQRSEVISDHQSSNESRESFFKNKTDGDHLSSQEKANRLKKRLNQAIILLIVLITIVLLALFYL